MTGPVKVDTVLMQTTASGSATIADNMISHAKTLSNGIDFVRNNWQGEAGDAFRATTHDQKRLLTQLIGKLQFLSETLKQGGEGFGSHDAQARSQVTAQGQQALNGSLNHR